MTLYKDIQSKLLIFQNAPVVVPVAVAVVAVGAIYDDPRHDKL